MCQISTVPVKISTASSACSVKRIRSVATMTLWRGRRSAHTPPISRNPTSGTAWQASTMPTSLGEPSSVTYSASASKTMRSPIVLAACPHSKSRQSRCRNTPSTTRHDGRMDVDGLFDAWERAWSGRDPGAFAPLCAEAFAYEDPLTPAPLDGVGALAAHARRLWDAFPDARVNSTGERLSNGRFACAPCKILGTHEGRIGGVTRTGRFLVVHALVYAELEDGRLLRARAFFDVHGAATALGVLPQPGTMGEQALLLLRGFGIRAT